MVRGGGDEGVMMVMRWTVEWWGWGSGGGGGECQW